MVFAELGRVMALVLGGWCVFVFGIIGVQLFRGRILSAGLLGPGNGRAMTVGRMQLLLTTIGIAVGYAGVALLRAPGEGMPDVPMAFVIALTGSHGIYLGGKRSQMQNEGRRR